MAYVAASRATLDARIYTDSDERLSAALARQVDKSTALEARRESHETMVRNAVGLIPIEPTPPLTPLPEPQPSHAERSARAERPPAQRAPQPVRSEPARRPAEPSPFERELQNFAQELAAYQTPRKTLPVPVTPPALPYTVITSVDGTRPASELSAELVQLANANRLARTGEEIAAPVQRVMQASLIKTAEQPPLPEQLQRIAKDCETLGLTETPEVGSALEASLWRAYNAPNRVEILEATTARVEAHLAQQQSPAPAVEPSLDDGPSFGYDSGPSIDIG